jgi:membrane-bound lytic murein transglycosylase D
MFWEGRTALPLAAVAIAAMTGGCMLPGLREAPPVVGPSAPAIMPSPLSTQVEDRLPTENPIAALPIQDLELWSYIGARLSLPRDARREIRAELAWFKRNRGYLERVSERSAPYLYFITQALEERGLPLDLALLPIIESAYQPKALSKSGAGGLWQFIPSTGHIFGLEQNWWYDGRGDVVSATLAALDYLSVLHREFDGDWLLALAAYNCGEANVLRAINRNKRAGKSIDFWSLKLPSETEAYVPRLLAAATLVADAARFRLRLHPVPNQPYFALIDLGRQTDLGQVAEIAGVARADFDVLNPGFRRRATPPDGPHSVLVPVQNAERLKSGLASLPPQQRLTWGNYVVQPGDTLGHIADQYETSVAEIQRSNKLASTLIRAGQKLTFPPAGIASDPEPAVRRDGAKRIYAVRSGDTLSHIAHTHRVSVSQLVAWNNLSHSALLYPRQRLEIWGDAKPVAGKDQRLSRTYNVKPGDSLWRIARRFKISVDDLRRWNSLPVSNLLKPGQQLLLAGNI